MKHRLLSLLAVGAVVLVLTPLAAAKTIRLHDGSQFVVAGSHVNCVVDWSQGVANVDCFILHDPLGKPLKGTYGFDISSLGITVLKYGGSSLKPLILRRLAQPASVPSDDASRKGSVRQSLVLHVGDVATVAGSSLLIASDQGKTMGIGAAVAPISNAGRMIGGAYVVGLTDKGVVVQRFTGAGNGKRIVYKRT